MTIYLQLYWEFFKTGLFAIGGGMATLPFLKDIGASTRDMRMFHQLYLRFSKDCTASSRKKTVTLR